MTRIVKFEPSIFDPLDYRAAVMLVLAVAGTSDTLRERIEQDAAVDPFRALSDAELLVELAKVRLRDAQQASLTMSP